MLIVLVLTGSCRTQHTDLQQSVLSLSAEEIILRLDDFELDVGLTYLKDQRVDTAGTREILECYLESPPIRDEYLIVQGGKLAGVGAHSYSDGNATGGSEEAAKFKAA